MSTLDFLVLIGVLLVVAGVIYVIASWTKILVERVRRLFERPPTRQVGEQTTIILPSLEERQARWKTLSPKEKEACRVAALGLSDKQVAKKLDRSWRTVGSHLSSSYDKLGINSRVLLESYLEDLVDE